jgi:hypothetical protein
MVFREVVGHVGRAAFPVDDELALADADADPVEAHVNGFGALLSDGVIGNTHGTLIVGLDGCGGLGMAQFGKGGAEGGWFHSWHPQNWCTGAVGAVAARAAGNRGPF